MNKYETEDLLLDIDCETLKVDELEVNVEMTNIIYITATVNGTTVTFQIESDKIIGIGGLK